MEIKYIKTKELIPYINNSRTHNDEQVLQIAASINEFGFTNPVLIDENNLIIAGHGRLLAAKKINMEEIPCIELKGLTDAQKKAYVIADNKLALNAGWNEEILKIELEGLKEIDYDIDILGFSNSELDMYLNIEENLKDVLNSEYTTKIEAPVYETSEKKPNIDELYHLEYYNEIISQIKKSDIDDEEKKFLEAAATRHIRFNYSKIAEYYAHSDKDLQNLFENSALVIIDYNKAIELGFVKIKKEIEEFINEDEID